jgi:hypothetical protein
MYLEESKDLLKKLNFISSEDIIPCTEKEVFELEEKLGFKIPEAYKEFLFWAGHKLGKVFKENLIYYKFVLQNNNELKFEIPNEGTLLPDNIFVIATDYAWSDLNFVYLNDGDDPTFYIYDNDNDEIRKVYDKFSDYILSAIEFSYKYYKMLGH